VPNRLRRLGGFLSEPGIFDPIETWEQFLAEVQFVGQPVSLSRTPSIMAARPPEFGEQTEEVLSEFEFSNDEIAELRQRRVI
jgi:crotonobetainyl-CoA:carnitine CoA-transferase CaiB-like acyl-CoA transferase